MLFVLNYLDDYNLTQSLKNLKCLNVITLQRNSTSDTIVQAANLKTINCEHFIQ